MVNEIGGKRTTFFHYFYFLVTSPLSLGRNFSFWDEILEQFAHFKKNSNFAAPKMTRK